MPFLWSNGNQTITVLEEVVTTLENLECRSKKSVGARKRRWSLENVSNVLDN